MACHFATVDKTGQEWSKVPPDMNWTLQMFKQIATGISGFFGLISDIADFLTPFAPYLIALSGAGIMILACLKIFTEWGQNLYASIVFVVSVFVAAIGLQFMDGEQASQQLAQYMPQMNDTTKSITEKLQGFANELQQEYDKIDARIQGGGAIASHKKLTVTAAVGNVRTEPKTNTEIKFRLPQGAQVTMLSQQGQWYQIKDSQGHTGWAHRIIFGQPQTKSTQASTP